MKAIVYEKFGSPEVLTIKDVPVPRPKDDQVLVKIKATSVNPVDYKVRQGILKPISRFKLPIIPGGDVAGVVEEVGFGVKKFQQGHEVFGLTPAVRGGAYAEYAAVNKNHLWFKPEKLSFEEASSIPLAGLTAFQGLYNKGRIYPKMQVFINGCTGGVGSFAVQIAKAYDCEVTGVCSENNINFATILGADHVIAYDSQDPLKAEGKFDIFYDINGNYSYSHIKHLLYNKGVFINTLPSASLFFNTIFNNKRVKFVWINSNRHDLANLRVMADKNLIRPHIDRIYPLQEAAKAHQYCQNESVRGKVVIKMS
jgi:NADPH:quinone reductase-like Zn-dependent oxidoreductase